MHPGSTTQSLAGQNEQNDRTTSCMKGIYRRGRYRKCAQLGLHDWKKVGETIQVIFRLVTMRKRRARCNTALHGERQEARDKQRAGSE